MKSMKKPMSGFKYAIEGVVHVLRTQRHMRFHFLTLVLVLMFSLIFKLSSFEVLILLFTVSLVITAEMFNTAIEAVVDLVTQTYHPLAKFAKDIAAGAVLITTINALAVAVILFLGGNRLKTVSAELSLQAPNPTVVFVIGIVLLFVMVALWKIAGGKGTILKGGLVSGHSAIGFFLAACIMFMSKKPAIAIMAYALAILIAQSRVEGEIHSLMEVINGAIVATAVAMLVFAVFAPIF